MSEQFISEIIKPVAGTLDTRRASTGEPALPVRFVWRKAEYEIAALLDTWHEFGPDRTHGGVDRYLRKHWFTIRTITGEQMTIYFVRQPASMGQVKKRWYLYTMTAPNNEGPVYG
ncbi:MAG: DUF6504 family protein [Candidatus Latescibacteria bacterium]|jgi:hypothetical protein|nr:DUF6504 family protein [Candidatus Latescibacterota bacterium]